jgi:hypothetical protein
MRLVVCAANDPGFIAGVAGVTSDTGNTLVGRRGRTIGCEPVHHTMRLVVCAANDPGFIAGVAGVTYRIRHANRRTFMTTMAGGNKDGQEEEAEDRAY